MSPVTFTTVLVETDRNTIPLDSGAVVISQAFPDGLETGSSSADEALSNLTEVVTSSLTLHHNAVDLNVLAYQGTQLQATSIVRWESCRPRDFV